MEREGVGWDRALPCCPEKPQGPTAAGTAILLSGAQGRAGPARVHLDPRDLAAFLAKWNFVETSEVKSSLKVRPIARL